MIYVTGNIHGEWSVFDGPGYQKLNAHDTVIICGDFGFLWEGTQEEQQAIQKLEEKPYTILFVDGSHENFDLLEQYPVVEYAGGKTHQLAANVYHLMRGHIFTIEGKKFFAFGGGESEEKQFYIEAEKWWPREMPTIQEMENGVRRLYAVDLKVDYIVTHNPAPKARVSYHPGQVPTQLETFFEEIVREVQYERWFYGAEHIDRVVTEKHIALFYNVIPVDMPSKKIPKGKEKREDSRARAKEKRGGLFRRR